MTSAMARSTVGQTSQGDAQRVQDLQQLQREYRHMELNRRAYADESQHLLRKQQANMEKLKRENDSLKTELAMEFRQFRTPIESGASERIAQLQEQAEHFVVLIDSERRSIDAMAEQTALIKHKILHQRKIMGGVNAAKENEFMVQKQVRILENRLDKALTKFNEALAHNKSLRQKIDDLRRERVLFDSIYKKMERELSDRKKMMANVIELSNVNYEQRDNFQLEIAAVEMANRREQDDFENQMLELGRQAEIELHTGVLGTSTSTLSVPGRGNAAGGRGARSRAGVATGITAASSAAALGAGRQRGEGDSANKHHPGMLTEDEDARLKARVVKATGPAAAEKTDAQASLERIQNFEEAFARIRSATGIEDIEELVRAFVKNEDQNFSLFNYVNEQQNEVEKLEEQLHQLEDEEKKFAQECGSDVHQHKQVLQELETKLVNTEAASEKYETRCSEANQTIEALKEGVQTLYGRVFGGGSVPETVGGGSVTDSNMMSFLGMIEEKTNALLQAYALAKEREKTRAQAAAALIAGAGEQGGTDDDASDTRALVPARGGNGAAIAVVLGHGPQTPMRQELIHVNPPKLEDFSSSEDSGSDDDDARPLTRDELKGRTLNKIQRKNAREGGGKGKSRGGRTR